MKRAKKIGKIFLWIGIGIVGLIVICLVVLQLHSRGALLPMRDAQGNVLEGAINEKLFVSINGVDQGMFIRAEDASKPVLLFLHGGPGSPELAILGEGDPESRLEQDFVVCYWDQRGAGMSFSSDLDPAAMTLSQFVEDTKMVTEYLMDRFDQEKIYLLGHSWGSYLGIKTIEKYPMYYHAYMGVGQVSKQQESERLAYDFLVEEAAGRNDRTAGKKLSKYDRNAEDFPPDAYMQTRSSLMNKYGVGMMRSKAPMFDVVKNLLLFQGYTRDDKLNYMRGMMFSQEYLWENVTQDDLLVSATRFEVPVFILHGEYDYQVSYTLAKAYYDIIDAPDKEFYSFANSAHSPNLEEPEAFLKALREIVARTAGG